MGVAARRTMKVEKECMVMIWSIFVYVAEAWKVEMQLEK